MKYFNVDGTELSLYASGAARLAHVEEHAPVGRFLNAPTGREWGPLDVRKMQDTGLWTVEWLEPGDTKREGAWLIVGLTTFGRNVLANWRKRQNAQ
ncbi:hypothetical protein [Streptomyces fractus]|uniref:hypothetical protein n=1 Tax=Streptomyces fractus TaxID=641806 RepID=UPI003CF553EA